MREVIYLTSAARQALQLEEWTGSDELRSECEDLGVLDSGNFTKALNPLNGHGVRVRTRGRRSEVRVNQVGFERAATIVRRISGEA
jgi:hypothetical protein